jgi:hypothetical protein
LRSNIEVSRDTEDAGAGAGDGADEDAGEPIDMLPLEKVRTSEATPLAGLGEDAGEVADGRMRMALLEGVRFTPMRGVSACASPAWSPRARAEGAGAGDAYRSLLTIGVSAGELEVCEAAGEARCAVRTAISWTERRGTPRGCALSACDACCGSGLSGAAMREGGLGGSSGASWRTAAALGLLSGDLWRTGSCTVAATRAGARAGTAAGSCGVPGSESVSSSIMSNIMRSASEPKRSRPSEAEKESPRSVSVASLCITNCVWMHEAGKTPCWPSERPTHQPSGRRSMIWTMFPRRSVSSPATLGVKSALASANVSCDLGRSDGLGRCAGAAHVRGRSAVREGEVEPARLAVARVTRADGKGVRLDADRVA